jgi:hypothetical protein
MTANSPDIRDKKTITHGDILDLNFIRKSQKYYFREHFREGLRSRIMQVLSPEDVSKETRGVVENGIRRYPLARPFWMLRIFRRPFDSLAEIEDEIVNYQTIQRYLPSAYYAASSEFLVDYAKPEGREIVLCGLQQFIDGESLDPWNPRILGSIQAYYRNLAPRKHRSPQAFADRKIDILQQHTQAFINHLKHLIRKTRRIPDLAGVGNILYTRSATIHLVDINNISKVTTDDAIPVDDQGYPACDKSVEALFLLEKGILGRPVDMQADLYRFFLNPERMQRVREVEQRFRRMHPGRDYPISV